MDAPYYAGDDERNLVSGPGDPRAAFWKAYDFARRHRFAESWLDAQRPYRFMAAWIAEADALRCDCGTYLERGVDHGGLCAVCTAQIAEASGSHAA